MLLRLYSEEQKPLEDFFEVKGLKTKNEMTEDVGFCSALLHRLVLTRYSPVP